MPHTWNDFFDPTICGTAFCVRAVGANLWFWPPWCQSVAQWADQPAWIPCTAFGKCHHHLTTIGELGLSAEKAVAPNSSTLAWKIPWMEEPGGLRSMGSQRVGHDWAISLWLFTFMHWRRKWQPTPVFLPGESQGRGSLVGCRLWDRSELDTTKVT